MAQDFLGSIADEDVQFSTGITIVTSSGENYQRTMIFIEGVQDDVTKNVTGGRFIKDPAAFTGKVAGTDIRYAVVDHNSYTGVVEDDTLLSRWLTDLYSNGNMQETMLVVFTDSTAVPAEAVAALGTVYDKVKDLAYHKTVCAGGDDSILPALAVALAKKCAVDKKLLSSVPYYPLTTATPEDLATDEVYSALRTEDPSFDTTDAFMGCYVSDPTRNGALYSLGLALGLLNSTGTPIGNNIDMWGSNSILPSGADGAPLAKSVRNVLDEAHVQYFKHVGDGSGSVSAIGVQTLQGNYLQANWIVNYVNFMSKVLTAQYITRPNVLRNSATYAKIIRIMEKQIKRFGYDGTGRLYNVAITAPAFDKLPPAKGNEILVPSAWKAEYTDQVHTVTVTGDLTIPA